MSQLTERLGLLS